ncbi:MAG: hypothetical protein RLZZ507_4056 [Cyanobacteriota bacterium]|jgi:hypothetical protein
MNYDVALSILFEFYKISPSEKRVRDIQDIMLKYQENPPDDIRENLLHKSLESLLENPQNENQKYLSANLWKLNKLSSAYIIFKNYPTNHTNELLKQALNEDIAEYLRKN